MTYRIMKRVITCFLLLCIFSVVSSYAQNPKESHFMTKDLARRIKYNCQRNDQLTAFFYSTNSFSSYKEGDKILSNLEEYPEYAEKYLMSIYNTYDVDWGYFAMKQLGLSIHEINIVEKVWGKGKYSNDPSLVVQTKSDYITQVMAKKIGYFCLKNQRSFYFFVRATQLPQYISDKILTTLDMHLDYAETFVCEIFKQYQEEVAYYQLRQMGLTIDEVENAQRFWKYFHEQEQERINQEKQDYEQKKGKRDYSKNRNK